jgi:ParB family chromosome partitioning protein
VAEKRPALGRGLSALIPEAPTRQGASFDVDLDLLAPNRFQPRMDFDEPGLEELARSIKTHGVIQPVVVRKVGTSYEIIAGERRWRAAQRAGLLKVPVIVRQVPDDKLLEVALIENIQRENLNPIDEAKAYKRLSDEFELTQDAIAEAVGKDRTSVANYMRLLKLDDDVQQWVAEGRLSMGHARAILGAEKPAEQREIARHVVDRDLSVRETEAFVRRLGKPRVDREPPPADVHTRAAEDRLKLALGTRVRIVRRAGGGHIEIAFTSEDELQRLYEQLLAAR